MMLISECIFGTSLIKGKFGTEHSELTKWKQNSEELNIFWALKYEVTYILYIL